MKKKIRSKIPKFKNYEEEAHFWDTHDITDFEDETENVNMVFELNVPREEKLIVRMQKNIKQKLENIARSKGLNISTLVRMWVMERLQTIKKN